MCSRFALSLPWMWVSLSRYNFGTSVAFFRVRRNTCVIGNSLPFLP